MNETTRNTLKIALALADQGHTVASVETHTPDGRTWSIATTSAGGYRLFEIDRDKGTSEEHDAVDAETWVAIALIEYLGAVGQPKPQ